MSEIPEGAVELLEGRFYWVTRRETPVDTASVHFFNTVRNCLLSPCVLSTQDKRADSSMTVPFFPNLPLTTIAAG